MFELIKILIDFREPASMSKELENKAVKTFVLSVFTVLAAVGIFLLMQL